MKNSEFRALVDEIISIESDMMDNPLGFDFEAAADKFHDLTRKLIAETGYTVHNCKLIKLPVEVLEAMGVSK